jgi:Bacterial SH3 domain
MVQLKIISLADRPGGNRRIREKADSYPSLTAACMPPVWNVANLTEARKHALRGAPVPVAAPIGRPSVKPAVVATLAPRGVNLTSGLGILIAVLVVGALVPNVILGAMFWFGATNKPSPEPVIQAPPIQTSLPAVLSSPAAIEAAAGEEIGFPIALDGTDGLPARSIIAIAGLPQGSLFSDGRPYGETEWNLKSDQIGDLRLTLPDMAHGESRLTIRLIAPDGAVIADAETILNVAQAAREETPPPDAGEVVLTAVEANVGGEAKLVPVPVEAAMAPPAAAAIAPSGTAAIAPPGESGNKQDQTESRQTDTPSGNWVQPSDHVNLRDGPSSSSRILGVVAKGAKVEVVDRKRGWLQVTNPATSEKGWIYSGYIEGASATSLRTRRAARAQPEQKSESFWSRVGQWF